jgi:flavin-dependent dehydrogenase
MQKYCKRVYDCVVVGGGPAGAAAAKRLVASGARVLMVEKEKMPRMKICSGILGTRAQERTVNLFGELSPSVLAHPAIIRARKVSIKGNDFVEKPIDIIIETGKQKKDVLQVWRSTFDKWLVDLSKVEIQENCRFINFRDIGGNLLIQCQHVDGRKEEIQSDFLIGADGGKSIVRKRLHPTFDKPLHWRFSYKVYIEGTIDLEPGYFYCFLHEDFGDFYSALLLKDGIITLGTTVNAGSKIRPYFSKYFGYLCEKFDLRPNSIIQKMGCWVNDMGMLGKFCLGGGRFLLVGEAGGFLNVMGEGISSALGTGDIAAQAILEGIQTGKDPGELYQEMVEPEMKWTRTSWASSPSGENEKKVRVALENAVTKA